MNGSGKSRFPEGMTVRKANATTAADPFIPSATRRTQVGLLWMLVVFAVAVGFFGRDDDGGGDLVVGVQC